MNDKTTTDEYTAITKANEAKALQAEADADAIVNAIPMKITFEFTGDCNLHCFFCDCEFGRNEYRKKGVSKFAMDETIFRSMAETAFPHVSVVNPTVIGEPMTFPHFDLMIDYALKYDVKLEIVTNGMLVKNPRLERMMPLLDRLTMSFDGGTKETFEHCRTGSKFDVIIKNMRDFRDLRRSMNLTKQVKFTFGVTLMRENIEEFPRIVEWAHELDVDEVSAGHLLVFTKELRGSSLFEHQALANEWIIKAQKRAEELGVKLSAPALFDLEEEVAAEISTRTEELDDDVGATGMIPRMDHVDGAIYSNVPDREVELMQTESPPPAWAEEEGRYWCQFAWRQVFVSIAGHVSPCCHQSRPVVGNVFEQDWNEIWNGKEYQALRRGLYEGKPMPYCASCSLLAEQGHVEYKEDGYIFEDKFPDQTRADIRPKKGDPK